MRTCVQPSDWHMSCQRLETYNHTSHVLSERGRYVWEPMTASQLPTLPLPAPFARTTLFHEHGLHCDLN